MKRICIILFILIAFFAFSSCIDSDKINTETKSPEATASETQQAESSTPAASVLPEPSPDKSDALETDNEKNEKTAPSGDVKKELDKLKKELDDLKNLFDDIDFDGMDDF